MGEICAIAQKSGNRGEHTPLVQRHTEDFNHGFKSIWSKLNSFCSYDGLFPVENINLDIQVLTNNQLT